MASAMETKLRNQARSANRSFKRIEKKWKDTQKQNQQLKTFFKKEERKYLNKIKMLESKVKDLTEFNKKEIVSNKKLNSEVTKLANKIGNLVSKSGVYSQKALKSRLTRVKSRKRASNISRRRRVA